MHRWYIIIKKRKKVNFKLTIKLHAMCLLNADKNNFSYCDMLHIKQRKIVSSRRLMYHSLLHSRQLVSRGINCTPTVLLLTACDAEKLNTLSARPHDQTNVSESKARRCRGDVTCFLLDLRATPKAFLTILTSSLFLCDDS